MTSTNAAKPCDALCRDIERDRDRLAAERDNLAATVAAIPAAHHAAHLAHARTERDRLRREVDHLREDQQESDDLRERMAELLTGTARALKGDPGPLVMHDWSDLPVVAAAAVARLSAVEAVLTDPAVTYSLNNANDAEVRGGREAVRVLTPMMTETAAVRAALDPQAST